MRLDQGRSGSQALLSTALRQSSLVLNPSEIVLRRRLLEDRSVFTQFSFNFQDDLPALLSRFRLELPSGWTAESITDNHRPIEPLVNGSSYSWQLEGLPPVSDEPARPGLRSIVPRVNVSYFPPSAVKAAGPTFRKWSQVSAQDYPTL